MSKLPSEKIQLLICRMLKGNREFRVSAIKIKENGKIEEIFFRKSKNISELGEAVFQEEILKKEKFEIKNNGIRCKKSKSTKQTIISRSDCGKVKEYEFNLFFAAATGQILV